MPLGFPRTRDREVLAYLVLKRGSSCTLQELAAVLYEDEPYTIQQRDRTRKLIFSLTQTLQDGMALPKAPLQATLIGALQAVAGGLPYTAAKALAAANALKRVTIAYTHTAPVTD